MLTLRVERSELTYEAALRPPLSAIIDTPGRLVSVLLSQFDEMGVNLSDVSIADGILEDRGLSCEIDRHKASILLRADRFEASFLAAGGLQDAAEILPGVWQAIASVSGDVTAKSHSLLFELDCEITPGSYAAALERYCGPYKGLPSGTETAVVYYLPPDRDQGFLDSSFVLNRSAEVEGGILLVATLVFDGAQLDQNGALEAARRRLNELLQSLDISLSGVGR